MATHFILVISTKTRKAAGGYVVVPEGFGQNEDPANKNGERTNNELSFAPKIIKRCTQITCFFY